MPDMMMLGVTLGITIAIFIIILIIGFNNYKVANKASFKMLSMFPFEMQNSWGMPYTFHVRFLSGLFVISYSLCALSAFISCNVDIAKVLMATLIITSFIMMGIIYINMNIVKIHLFFSVSLFIFAFLNYGLLTILLLAGNPQHLPSWLGYVSGSIGLIYLASLFNPKLYKWMVLEKRESEEGATIYSRPKHFVLPIYEWITMGLNLLILVIVLIGYVI